MSDVIDMEGKPKKEEKKRRIDLTSGPLLRRLITFAWPLFVGNILTTFYNLADMYWVSYVGDEAVASIALTFPTVWLNVSLGLGVTIAAVAFVSQYTGAGKTDEAGRVAGQVILLAIAVAIVLGSLGILARKSILTMMGAEGPVLAFGTDYLRIVLAGLPFQYIYLTFRSVAQGTGDSKTPRNLLIVTVLINATLDPFLILGLAGLPALDVKGAAWATFTAEGVGALLSIIFLVNGRIGGVKLRLGHLKPDWTFLKRAAAIGLPGSFDMGLRGLSSVVTAGIVARTASSCASCRSCGLRRGLWNNR